MKPQLFAIAATLLAQAAIAGPQDPPASSAAPAAAVASDPVIQPEVTRQPVRLPRLPSNDFFVGLYGGSVSTQNFGSSGLRGLRLGYHLTEDVFLEASVGSSKVSDSAFRQILPGGVFAQQSVSLRTTSAAVGYNLISGEAFFGRQRAKAMQGYVLAGIGTTTLADQRHQTITLGLGWRLIINDALSVQTDFREHLYALDLLGQRQSTRNPELSLGLTVNF
jgi:outer membrane beta-barrel protein